jgi:anti-anti-sigma factor
MPEFTLTESRLSDDTCLIVTGSMLDNSNAPDMLAAIARASGNGYRRIIVDMSVLEFLSSAGVGAILGSVEEIREMGGDIVLCGLSPTIRHVLDVLDLSSYLTIVPNRERAVQVVAGTSGGSA